MNLRKKTVYASLLCFVLSANVAFAEPNENQNPDGGAGDLIDDILNDSQAASNRMANWLARMGVHAKMNLFRLELLKGVNFHAGFDYDVEPSFTKSLYTRTDRYFFETSLAPQSTLSAVDGEEFSVEAGLKHKMEIYFARQFNSAAKAFTAMPYWVDQVPYKAKNLQNLEVGDYVAIRARMTLLVGAEFVRLLTDVSSSVFATPFYAISGEFQVNVLKLPGDKIRLKIVGLRRQSSGLNVKLGYDEELELFSIDYLNNRLTKIMDLNPVRLNLAFWERSELLFADYVLNMNTPEVREAYDQVVKKAFNFEEVKILGIFNRYSKLRENLVIDIAPIEKIVHEDRGLEDPRILRKFKGSNRADGNSTTMKLGVRLARLNMENKSSVNNLVYVSDEENRQHYVMDSQIQRFYGNFWFSWLYLKTEKKLNALFTSDEEFKNLQAENIVYSYEARDKKFTYSNFKELQQKIRHILPPFVFSQIDFSGWKNPQVMKPLTFYRYYFILEPQMFDVIGHKSAKQIFKLYKEYIAPLNLRVNSAFSTNNPKNTVYVPLNQKYDQDLQYLSKLVEKALNTKNSSAERVRAIMKASKNPVFAATGLGFLIQMVPANMVDEVMSFHLDMSSASLDEVRFRFGQAEESELYKQILLLQSVMYNNGLDLRLEAETLSEERITNTLN